MSSQSSVTTLGQPRARDDAGVTSEASPCVGGEGLPNRRRQGRNGVVKAPALLAQEVFTVHEAWRVIVRAWILLVSRRRREARPFDCMCKKRALLQDISPPTSLEQSKGN